MINIITYNILSPSLCNQDEFQEYDPESLDEIKRKNKIILLIDEWTSKENRPIICLQEVPSVWKGSLEKIFLNRKYIPLSMNYGNRKSGFFGVLTAVHNSYQIDKIEYLNIGDYIDAIQPPLFKPQSLSFIDKLINTVISPAEEDDYISIAKNRSNIALKLTLNSDKKFIIYNYHMPCAYKTPIVQTLHLDGLKRLMSEHRDVPTILATDFNLTPDSVGYEYFTLAKLPVEHSEYLQKTNHYGLMMMSSYKEVNKSEPLYTCYSDTRWGGKFKNTLDYIFISGHFKTLTSKILINVTEKMPNVLNPSDHLPIESCLQIN